VDVPNKSTNRGKGKPDMNVRAYETMLIAIWADGESQSRLARKSCFLDFEPLYLQELTAKSNPGVSRHSYQSLSSMLVHLHAAFIKFSRGL
jgi:hypothetical protein